MRILVTGARAPVALEWARLLLRLGHEVWLADAVPWVLSRGCRGARKFLKYPSARFQPAAFTATLLEMVGREKFDLILPTCEEVFYLDAVGKKVRVLAPSQELLRRLHGKLEFQKMATEAGLPATRTIRHGEMEDPAGWWAKPEFSRFATRGGPAEFTQPSAAEARGWIAQEWLQGDEWCCYAVAMEGRLAAFSSYRSIFRSGRGASVSFVQERMPVMQDWVRQFAEFHQLTGQLSFDFMRLADGRMLPLECNPRATSGLHLLVENVRWVEAMLRGEAAEVVCPSEGFGRMLALPMLLAEKKPGWKAAFHQCRDAVWKTADPLPGIIGQPMSLACFGLRAWRRGISLNEAFTWDIEWNGS